ncbi:baseplate J/gp47 family protein [Nodosilinea sp. AN01ver1]|uniref:baseplate J/gp47 family protein n=1 Tax=Nodosilinea sp. AN01ver1 TaxID=3423362 RepID=UPI003D311340
MSFRRRPFPEVLDNLLTGITQGVSSESHPFPPPGATGPPFRHTLQQPPVAEIQSVYGQRDGESVLFRQGSDYALAGGNTLVWLEGAQLPDPGTLLAINYYPQAALPVLTDIYTGSVVRTLSESVALEIARLYAQLEQVYDSGFVDTASDRALDHVVALLGIERVQGGLATGLLEFTRAANSRGAINIPAGTRAINADGSVEYETIETVQMAPDQTTVRVPIRDLEPNDPLPANALTTLVVPLAGVASITNPAPTAIATRSETDAELRSRTKNFLYGSQRATLGALQQAIASQGLTAEIEELTDATGVRRLKITPLVQTLPPDQYQRLYTALEAARPAGIPFTIAAPNPPVPLNVSLRLTTASGLLEQELRGIQHTLQQQIADYFAQLTSAEPGSLNRLIGLALAINGVEDVQILSIVRTEAGTQVSVMPDPASGQLATQGLAVRLGSLDIADPNLPTRLAVQISHPDDADPADLPAIEATLRAAIATVNDLNASETTPAEQRQLSYGRLLAVVPLPNHAAASLPETAPPVPNIGPYQVQFVITQATQFSQVLTAPDDVPYRLTPFERLSLDGVVRTTLEATDG